MNDEFRPLDRDAGVGPAGEAAVEIVADDDGIAVLGDPADVERFLGSAGLSSRPLDLQRLGSAFRAGAGAAHAAATVSAESGRWVKLTKESAEAMRLGQLMRGSTSGARRAILTEDGKIKGALEIVASRGSALTNPALLTGVAGIMTQLAMQHSLDEIGDYLAEVDAKVEKVLRHQRDAVLADLDGVQLIVEEALVVRERLGKVPETTWSTLQGAPFVIARTQASELRRLEALTERLGQERSVGELARTSAAERREAQQSLEALARCVRLQECLGVLELDRVLTTAPDDLDRHRLALVSAREDRARRIARTAAELLGCADGVVHRAKGEVLVHPWASRAAQDTGAGLAADVLEFRRGLGMGADHEGHERRRWVEAVADVGDAVRGVGAAGLSTAGRVGGTTVDRARSVTGKLAGGAADRARRLRRRAHLDDDPRTSDDGPGA